MDLSLPRCSALWLVNLFLTAVLISCGASRSYLVVDYRLPASSQTLKKQTVRLRVKDLRDTQKVFTVWAAEQFQGFKGRYRLHWISQSNVKTPAGEYDLKDLFRQTFLKRLQEMGATVAPDNQENVPVFEVVINRFVIDLKEHKWTADVRYEADLSKDSQLIARDTVTGQAERIKIIGSKGADVVLSEIFTDIINRLDIQKLFEQAKLL